MSKNIEAKAGNLTDLNYKLDLQNFGVDKIYVITDFENTARKEAFIEAWNNFKGFDYTFTPAIMGKNLSIPNLLLQKKISENFYDTNPTLSHNVYGVALAHREIYKTARKNKIERIMILEDDARPSSFFYDYIMEGKFLKMIHDIKNLSYYTYFVGLPFDINSGRYLNGVSVEMIPFQQFAAHAYIVHYHGLKWLIDRTEQIEVAADVVLQGPWNDRPMLACQHSIIQQQGILLNKWKSEDESDPDFIFRSQTQPRYNEKDEENYPPHINISKSILKHVESIEEKMHYDQVMYEVKLKSNLI